jgi:beta-phosphoglucomutase-like phosphatase (HAD superfamily)
MNTLLNTPSGEIEYAFFDMDGTLVETDYANFLAYNKAINSVLNIRNTIEFNPNHRFDKNSLKQQFQNLSDFQYKRIIQLKNKLTNDFLSKTFVNSKVVEAFISMSETKRTVLVTNASFDRAMQTMKFHGLDRYLDAMFCSGHRSSDANKYQHAIETLGASTKNIVLFENEDKEVLNALNSGVQKQKIFKV